MNVKELLKATDLAWSDAIQAIGRTFYEAKEDERLHVHWDNLCHVVENMDLARAEYYDSPEEDKLQALLYWYEKYREESLDFALAYTKYKIRGEENDG